MSRHTERFRYRTLDAAEMQRYREDGFLILKGVLTPAGLSAMTREAMEAWSSEKSAFDPSRTWLENSLMVNIHHRSTTIRDYYFEGPLVDVAEQLIGPNVKGATSQLTFKMAGNVKPFGWHQDNGYGELDPYNALTTLTALDDTDRGNGCLWLIPGSHRQGQIQVHQTPEQKRRNSEIVVEAEDALAVPMEMQAGDALVFNCWMLHKSDGNLSAHRHRRILFLGYADADAVEVYNGRRPRLGRLLRGASRFPEVERWEADI